MFNHLRAGLRPLADGSIDYGFEFALPRIPASEVHQLHGVWSLDTARRKRGDWGRAPYAVLGLSEPVIAGERELFELPGPEGFPAAVAMLDHARKQVRIVIAAPDYDARYPKGPSIDQLMAVSRKADHDRLMAMKRIQQEREALYRSQGMLPNDATLKSYRDLQELGFLSRPPRWVAQRIGAAELASMSSAPRFDIDEMEFKVGLMSDLAQAIAQPGAEIDQHMGRYITHRDYPNAARLNEVLERGATELVIRYRGEDFHLRLLPRVEAKKDLAR
jgi:hypothetical protein